MVKRAMLLAHHTQVERHIRNGEPHLSREFRQPFLFRLGKDRTE